MGVYGNGFIWNDNPTQDEFPAYLTISDIPPNTNIFASVSISALTQGVNLQTGVAGYAAAAVRRWEVFNPDGSVSSVDPGPNNVWLNSNFIPNCASVTWEVSTVFAEAWAQISVFDY